MTINNASEHQLWDKLQAANEAALLAHLGSSPLAESYFADNLSWVITSIEDNTYNGVLRTRLSDAEADQVIAEVLERFRKRDIPFLWHVDDDSLPYDLAERLMAHGCRRLADGVGMGIDLSGLNQTPQHIAGLAIGRIATQSDLADWMNVWADSIDPSRDDRERLYLNLGLDGDKPLRHYLARLNGKPVAISSLFLSRDVAGIYSVAVIPEAQRQGIGTAITLAPLYDAKQSGYRLAIVGPTPESQRMYERIGFSLFSNTSMHYYYLPTPEFNRASI